MAAGLALRFILLGAMACCSMHAFQRSEFPPPPRRQLGGRAPAGYGVVGAEGGLITHPHPPLPRLRGGGIGLNMTEEELNAVRHVRKVQREATERGIFDHDEGQGEGHSSEEITMMVQVRGKMRKRSEVTDEDLIAEGYDPDWDDSDCVKAQQAELEQKLLGNIPWCAPTPHLSGSNVPHPNNNPVPVAHPRPPSIHESRRCGSRTRLGSTGTAMTRTT